MRKVKILMIAEMEITDEGDYRDQITAKLDALRDSTQMSMEHGVTLYQPVPGEIEPLVSTRLIPIVGGIEKNG